MEGFLSWTRVILSLVFLGYASWSDFKTREVSNNVWIVFAPAAFLLTFTQFLFFPPMVDTFQSMISYGISFAVTSVFSIVLFYVGAFGGADAKALMCIALAFPLPLGFFEPLSRFVSPIFPITVFSNGVVLAAFTAFYAVLRNLSWKQRTGQKLFEGHENERFVRKALALLCGYKVTLSNLKDSFLFPLEDFQTTPQGETMNHLLLFPKDEDREEIVERLVTAEREGKLQNLVWATPGLPMLIFITLGLVMAFAVGDLVWIVISQAF
ncbi:MAG: A24 family peptidase C-terminal domain-containing protein [Candidatus Bathyarchaeia archaeon]